MNISRTFSWRHPAAWSDRPLLRRLAVAAVAVAVVLGCAWLAWEVSTRQGIAEARVEANHRIDLFASVVNGVVRRLEPVPATIQLNPEVLALLREPLQAHRVAAVSDYLRRLNAHVGSISAFVLNDRGVVLASSHTKPHDDSSIGEDISFRPYFLEALSGRVGRHFAIGKGHQAGYFVSHPIHDGTRVVGVAAIKIGLDPIDRTWHLLGAPGLVADTNEVVVLASNPAWRYTALAELPLERRVDLQLTRMYNNLRVPRFPVPVELPADDSFRIIGEVVGDAGPARRRAGSAGTMVLGRTLDGMDWRLMIFVDLAAMRSHAALSSLMAALAAGFVVLLGLHLDQRRRILRQRLEARHLLERVNSELELKVDARTADLTEANARLRTEVGEREQAERNLRAAQGELVHAAKMAMLGQLAASITHELTQPLGAIRTLSGNAAEFQRRGDQEALAGNLKIIARLADQMGSIIQPLKGFARKAQPIPSRADVAVAVGNALFLYDLPLRKHGVEVVNRCALGRHSVWCDPNRLEQVLINLIGNAIDSMAATPVPTLTIEAGTEWLPADGPAGDGVPWVRIDVLDTGTGLPQAVRERLFEPFFTTKPGGSGLGLGLVISRDIVRSFGGDIEATERAAPGGSRFSVRLPAAPPADAAEPAAAESAAA